MTLLIVATVLIVVGLLGLITLVIAARAARDADTLIEQKRRTWKDGE